MRRHRLLAAISAAQLGFNLAGLTIALRRRYPFDLPGWRGSPQDVGRDAWWMGTAYSAPAPMLLVQSASIVVLATRPHRRAQRTVGALGTAMIGGYAVERRVRQRVSPGGWDPLESPIVLAGWLLAVGMAVAAAPDGTN